MNRVQHLFYELQYLTAEEAWETIKELSDLAMSDDGPGSHGVHGTSSPDPSSDTDDDAYERAAWRYGIDGNGGL